MTGIYSLLEGRTLSGRYQVERLISKGGMGAVFRGTDLTLNRTVAVKVIALEPESAEQMAGLRARFRREAHAAAALRHPHVVTLYDFGTDEAMELDFIVMELLEGEDLQRRVRRMGPLPWRQVSRILYEAARGLGAGHRAGLVHRDVKSANLFLEHDAGGRPLRTRVLDFGIAQLKAGGTSTATHLTVMGHTPLSPPYASPEQQRGERELTPAADVWGLGVTAFEMLTGSLPYNEAQRAELAAGRAVPAPALRPPKSAIPPEAEALIRRALSLRPEDRPRDGEAFAREINAIRRSMRADTRPPPEPIPAAPVYTGRPVLMEPPPLPPAERRPVPPPLPPAEQRQAPPPGPRRGGVGAAAALVATVVVFAALGSTLLPDGGSAGSPVRQQGFTSAPIAAPRAATESEIQYIRQVYQLIEAGTTMPVRAPLQLQLAASNAWPSADSASALVYGDPRVMGKIRVRAYEGAMRTSQLFYYDAGKLVFVHEITAFTGSGSDAEQRFYFRDRALIRWRDQANQIVPLGPAYADVARTLLDMSDALLAAAGGE
jgi:serine/threonine protein kinase